MASVVWQRRALKLRAKVDTYQGNARLKTHVRSRPPHTDQIRQGPRSPRVLPRGPRLR